MLNKLKKFLIFIVVVGALGYVGFLTFVVPSGFVDKEVLINSYFENIESETVCTDHFNSETVSYCTSFKSLIDSRTLEITDLIVSGDEYRVVIEIDGSETTFDISFIEIEVTGIKSFLNKTYYKIDFII